MTDDERCCKNLDSLYYFMWGQSDCEAGKKHKNRNEHYDRGYAAQYEIEQQLTQKQEQQQ